MNTPQRQEAGHLARTLLDKGHRLSDRVYVLHLPDTNTACEDAIAGLSEPISEQDYKDLKTPVAYVPLGELAQVW